jgi:hypothetical protein
VVGLMRVVRVRRNKVHIGIWPWRITMGIWRTGHGTFDASRFVL